MPPERRDVVVVGAGVMGLAAARALAGQGRDVLALERFHVGHPHGSSHGSARIFRLAYPDPAFVRMGRDARDLWTRLEDEIGEQLLRPTPAVSIGPTIGALEPAMRAGGATIEVLPAVEVGSRFPMLRLPGVDRAILEPDAAVIAAGRALDAFRASAVRHGADIREGQRVLSLHAADGGAEVVLEGDTLVARAAIVAAGSWSRGLLARAGIELRTWSTVETVGYYAGPGEAPILLHWDDPTTTYCLPAPDGGLKAAEHKGGPTREPDDPTPPDDRAAHRVGRWLQANVAGASARPTATETCRYTMTADERFVLERHGPIVVASACSGHGFKFAPLVGERVAALVGHP